MGRDSAKCGSATTAASAQGGSTTADKEAWAGDDAERSSASVAERPRRTGERAAQTGGRAAAEEVEMAKAVPERLHGLAIRDRGRGNSSSSPVYVVT